LATADASTITIAIQIGGRVRGKITLNAERATDVDAVRLVDEWDRGVRREKRTHLTTHTGNRNDPISQVLEAVLASDFGPKHIACRQHVKKVFIAPNGKVASVVVDNTN
jgi:hypothetical protein